MGGESRVGAKAGGEARQARVAASAEPWLPAQAPIHSRPTVMPRRLAAPGPDPIQLRGLLRLAAAAPDHGQLAPWRFVVVPPSARARLAEDAP